jgi:hypothetical protein
VPDVDTIVVPAHADGFEDVFLGEQRWHAVQIGDAMLGKLKYIAAYRVSPISAITHIATIKSIERWRHWGSYVIKFVQPAEAIKPIPMVKGGLIKQFQGRRYTTRVRLLKAKNLDEVFP